MADGFLDAVRRLYAGGQEQGQSVTMPYNAPAPMTPESVREPGPSMLEYNGQPRSDPAMRGMGRQTAPAQQPAAGQQAGQPQAQPGQAQSPGTSPDMIRDFIQQAVNATRPVDQRPMQVDPNVYLEQYGRAKDRITNELSKGSTLQDIAQAFGSAQGSRKDFGSVLNAMRAAKISEQMKTYEMERDYAKAGLDAHQKQMGQDPAAVAAFKFGEGLSPADRERFMPFVRAPQSANLGDRVVITQPGGGPATTMQKGVPPQDQPGFRSEVKRAEVGGTELGKREFNMAGINDVIGRAKAILSGQQPPTGSYMGWAVDKAGQVIGYSPPGATEATELDSIGGALTAMMPRMEGPQGVYDVELYQKMAGRVGDRTVPVDQRLAALSTVEGLWAKYGKPTQQAPAGQGPAPGTVEQGYRFRGGDPADPGNWDKVK